MRPLDRRLLRYARQTAIHIGVLVGLGAVTAVLVILQARLLAGAISDAFLGPSAAHGAAAHGAAANGPPVGLSALKGALAALAIVLAARVLVAWATETSSYRASAAVKSALRRRLLAHAVELGPQWLAGKRTGELVTLATRGIDALDGYFASYLPQLVLSIVVPLAVVAQIGSADLVSGITIALTLPLIPLFGALVGRATAKHTRRRWLALALLSHHFLDVVAGLPTLKVFGRAKAQTQTIRKVTAEYRQATMGTLRLAFLSSLVLELAATLSVALVAVGIGLRLVYGHLDLRTGLLVLILAPEAYLPLRAAAAQFHASADGLAAAAEVFAVLEEPAHPAGPHPAGPHPAGDRAPGGRPAPPGMPAPDPLAFRAEEVSVTHPGRPDPAPDGVSLRIARGEIAALAGPSGCGKSTLVAVLLGFAHPSAGRVVVEGTAGDTDLADIDPNDWRAHVAWLPQDPVLFAGTVASNIRLGLPGASDADVAAAARDAALTEIGLETPVGESGKGLSAGQRRRVALARALLPGRPVLLLDEPTAGLDAAREAHVLATLRRLAAAGHAVLVVTHKPAALATADRVIQVDHTSEKVPT
jgi:ATP-binding cassette subfamily C protein CydCD